MKKLHLDFETRATVDIQEAGADVYSRDENTDVLCMAWAIGDGPVTVQIPTESGKFPLPNAIYQHLKYNNPLYAYNAAFEHLIWNNVLVPKYDWPMLPIQLVYCVMAKAYAMALPGSLDRAASALCLPVRKDDKGRRIMLQLCKPKDYLENGQPVWWSKEECPEKYDALYAYNLKDVEVEREVDKRTVELSDSERQLWLLDNKINRGGVRVDTTFAKRALILAQYETKKLNEKMQELTNNEVGTCNSHVRLTDWLRNQGVNTPGVAKDDILNILKRADWADSQLLDASEYDSTEQYRQVLDCIEKAKLNPVVREVLILRQQAAKSSVAKYKKMLAGVDSQGCLQGMFQFHGAATGRWAGRRVQLHNMPRTTFDISKVEEVIEFINTSTSISETRDTIELLYGAPMDVLSECLRSTLIASDGCTFVAGDFSQIESRMLAWLAGEEWKLDAFRGADRGALPDIYVQGYAKSFGVSIDKVTDNQRQIGKVQDLALGYQGGAGAFRQMGKVYGVEASTEEAENMKQAWRDAHPMTVKLWEELDKAAMSAVKEPGHVFSYRSLSYVVKGSFLFCKLPSGRVICYPYPKLKYVTTPWGSERLAVTYEGINSYTNKWERLKTYGGKLVENVTQAAARDVLKDKMLLLDSNSICIVLHIHDEIVAEVLKKSASIDLIKELYDTAIPWAPDLPMASKFWIGTRFRK